MAHNKGPMHTQPTDAQRTLLVTGFPLDAARELIRQAVGGGDRVLLLVRDKFVHEAERWRDSLPARADGHRPALEIWTGDILALDLGLTGAQVRQLHAEVHEVHHLAAVAYMGIDAPRMRQLNVEGLREVFELAMGMRQLTRVCVWSTVFVAGARSGVVRETELDDNAQHRNAYESTKAEAERLCRAAMAKLPLTVVRVPLLVGHSKTGEVTRLDGPLMLVQAILSSPTAIPLPTAGHHLLHLAPVDYCAAAALHLTRHPDAVGGTFHLVDDAPLTARQFFDLVADAAGKPRPNVYLPSRLSHALLRMPGLGSRVRHERGVIEWFDNDVRFDSSRARALLGGSGIHCPPVPTYLDALVRHVRER